MGAARDRDWRRPFGTDLRATGAEAGRDPRLSTGAGFEERLAGYEGTAREAGRRDGGSAHSAARRSGQTARVAGRGALRDPNDATARTPDEAGLGRVFPAVFAGRSGRRAVYSRRRAVQGGYARAPRGALQHAVSGSWAGEDCAPRNPILFGRHDSRVQSRVTAAGKHDSELRVANTAAGPGGGASRREPH